MAVLKPPLLSLDLVVDMVSEKIRESFKRGREGKDVDRAQREDADSSSSFVLPPFGLGVIVDGLGTLYPRRGRGPDTEEGDIWRINQDL